MVIGGFGWEIFFYIIMMLSVVFSVAVIPISFFYKRARKILVFLMWSYGVGCIGHLGGLGRILGRYAAEGHFKAGPMVLWTLSGIAFLAFHLMCLFAQKKGLKIGYGFYLASFILLGFGPTLLFMIFS